MVVISFRFDTFIIKDEKIKTYVSEANNPHKKTVLQVAAAAWL